MTSGNGEEFKGMQISSRAGFGSVAGFAFIIATAVQAFGQDVMTAWDSIKPMPPPALKAVSLDPAKTALIVMDFDKKTCVPARRARCADALPNVSALLAKARAKQMLVVH